MAQTTAPRCFFVDCTRPATHTVKRLWQIPGRAPFPLLYCCEQHRPGSGPKYVENHSAAAALRQRLEGRTFYDVRPIDAA